MCCACNMCGLRWTDSLVEWFVARKSSWEFRWRLILHQQIHHIFLIMVNYDDQTLLHAQLHPTTSLLLAWNHCFISLEQCTHHISWFSIFDQSSLSLLANVVSNAKRKFRLKHQIKVLCIPLTIDNKTITVRQKTYMCNVLK